MMDVLIRCGTGVAFILLGILWIISAWVNR